MKSSEFITEEEFPSVNTLTPGQVAAKHEVPVAEINKQLDIGTGVELEHTTDRDVAREIALDHLAELPDYYTRLNKMER